MDYYYMQVGQNFVLYLGRQAIWEDVTARKVIDYCREHYNVWPRRQRFQIAVIV